MDGASMLMSVPRANTANAPTYALAAPERATVRVTSIDEMTEAVRNTVAAHAKY